MEMATVSRPDTRTAVARLILENGPQTAADLGERLGLSPAAIRRHLDALVADGLLDEREPARPAGRGRGRPARAYAMTDIGRATFPHAYDDLATTALRYLRTSGGDAAVMAFAEHRAVTLEAQLTAEVTGPITPDGLARALTEQGYPTDVRAPGPTGTQLCQHHCPVAHVAAEFPQLCAAETHMFERVLGTYVQRLATIGHGDGVCTTHVPRAGSRSTPPYPGSVVAPRPAARSTQVPPPAVSIERTS